MPAEHFWSKLCPIMLNHLNMLITKILGGLLVAGGPLSSYKNFHQDWTKIIELEPKSICPYLGMYGVHAQIWAYGTLYTQFNSIAKEFGDNSVPYPIKITNICPVKPNNKLSLSLNKHH